MHACMHTSTVPEHDQKSMHGHEAVEHVMFMHQSLARSGGQK